MWFFRLELAWTTRRRVRQRLQLSFLDFAFDLLCHRTMTNYRSRRQEIWEAVAMGINGASHGPWAQKNSGCGSKKRGETRCYELRRWWRDAKGIVVLATCFLIWSVSPSPANVRPKTEMLALTKERWNGGLDMLTCWRGMKNSMKRSALSERHMFTCIISHSALLPLSILVDVLVSPASFARELGALAIKQRRVDSEQRWKWREKERKRTCRPAGLTFDRLQKCIAALTEVSTTADEGNNWTKRNEFDNAMHRRPPVLKFVPNNLWRLAALTEETSRSKDKREGTQRHQMFYAFFCNFPLFLLFSRFYAHWVYVGRPPGINVRPSIKPTRRGEITSPIYIFWAFWLFGELS